MYQITFINFRFFKKTIKINALNENDALEILNQNYKIKKIISILKLEKQNYTTKIKFTELDGKIWDISYNIHGYEIFDIFTSLNEIFQI